LTIYNGLKFSKLNYGDMKERTRSKSTCMNAQLDRLSSHMTGVDLQFQSTCQQDTHENQPIERVNSPFFPWRELLCLVMVSYLSGLLAVLSGLQSTVLIATKGHFKDYKFDHISYLWRKGKGWWDWKIIIQRHPSLPRCRG